MMSEMTFSEWAIEELMYENKGEFLEKRIDANRVVLLYNNLGGDFLSLTTMLVDERINKLHKKVFSRPDLSKIKVPILSLRWSNYDIAPSSMTWDFSNKSLVQSIRDSVRFFELKVIKISTSLDEILYLNMNDKSPSVSNMLMPALAMFLDKADIYEKYIEMMDNEGIIFERRT
jgi:hypothetical protein